MINSLIIYSSTDGHTKMICERIINFSNQEDKVKIISLSEAAKLNLSKFNKIIIEGNNFLIDRGDLSKDISVYKIPETQRKLIKIKNNYKNKKIFIATNLLESMIYNNYPTRAEANDIYSCIEMGADGLVLAAETAIGKNPIECIKFIKEMINQFK